MDHWHLRRSMPISSSLTPMAVDHGLPQLPERFLPTYTVSTYALLLFGFRWSVVSRKRTRTPAVDRMADRWRVFLSSLLKLWLKDQLPLTLEFSTLKPVTFGHCPWTSSRPPCKLVIDQGLSIEPSSVQLAPGHHFSLCLEKRGLVEFASLCSEGGNRHWAVLSHLILVVGAVMESVMQKVHTCPPPPPLKAKLSRFAKRIIESRNIAVDQSLMKLYLASRRIMGQSLRYLSIGLDFSRVSRRSFGVSVVANVDNVAAWCPPQAYFFRAP